MNFCVGFLETGGYFFPGDLNPSHELFILGVAAQLDHAGVIAEQRVVGHATPCHATQPGDRLMWLVHLGARRRQDESSMMKMVVVLAEAGRSLNLLFCFLRLGFGGIEKSTHGRNVFLVTCETSAPRPSNSLRYAVNGFPSLLPAPQVG